MPDPIRGLPCKHRDLGLMANMYVKNPGLAV